MIIAYIKRRARRRSTHIRNKSNEITQDVRAGPDMAINPLTTMESMEAWRALAVRARLVGY